MDPSKTIRLLSILGSKYTETRLSEFFDDKVVVYALHKYALSTSPKPNDTFKSLKYISREYVASSTIEMYSRLTEYILATDFISYNQIVADTKCVDKVLLAIIAIYFNKFDFIPKMNDELKYEKNVKLLARMYSKHCNSYSEINKCLELAGSKTPLLSSFSSYKCISFAAGAHNNKTLCNNIFAAGMGYAGFIVQGARVFQHSKLEARFQLTLSPDATTTSIVEKVNEGNSWRHEWCTFFLYLLVCALLLPLIVR